MPTKVSHRKSSSRTSIALSTKSASEAKTLTDDKQPIPCPNATRQDSLRPSEHQFELLQYDWPDLPPIAEMKDAVCRQSVSRGISYLLPVDRGFNSVNNRYRTDLRAMFQEPYVFDDRVYRDSVIGLSSRVHFLTNQANSRWTSQLARSVPIKLNTAFETIRKSYSRSAPVNGTRRGLGYGLAPRREHGLPLISHVQTELSPEIVILKREVEEMMKRSLTELDTGPVREKGQLFSADNLADQTVAREPNWPVLNHRYPGKTGNITSESRDDSQAESAEPSTKQSYEEFCAKLSKKCQANRIPERFVSPYLKDERNQEIWAWLHNGETISEFDYFMSLCG